jgi:hypothetical protein
VLSRRLLGPAAPVIGAGCGRLLVADLARGLDQPWRDFGDLVGCCDPMHAEAAAVCAPAVAVALLAAEGLPAAA